MRKPAVLFISYDGILEPLGQSQVFAYAKRLSKEFRMVLLSFEKEQDLANSEYVQSVKREAVQYDIEWIPLRYHKRPRMLATGFDLLSGVIGGLWVALTRKTKIIHCRGYIPTAMGAAIKALLRTRLIFDMRGFWIDEGVEKGDWTRNSKMYKIGKQIERICITYSDAVVSLTQAAVSNMSTWESLRYRRIDFRVISTCCDLQTFTPNEKLNSIFAPFTFGYVGNIGIWYNFDAVLECFKHLLTRLPDARFLIINRYQRDLILEKVAGAGIPLASVELKGAEHDSVADEIRRMHATAFFIKPSFAKIASAPTKLGELLGCGIPCLTSRGIGDMDTQLTGGNVGVLVDFNQLGNSAILEKAASDLIKLAKDPNTPQRCREAALMHFSLDEGSQRYQRLYQDLLSIGQPR